MVIREADRSELHSVLKLCRKFFDSTEWSRDTTFDEGTAYGSLWQWLSDPMSTILIIADGGHVRGATAIQIAPMPWGHADLIATEVFWYVDEAYRSGGAGLLLFKAAEAWAKEAGAKVMLMGSLVTSPPHVRTIYERAGYRESQTAFIKRIN